MSTFKLTNSDFITIQADDKSVRIAKKDSFDKFNEDILGLGKIETESKQVNALSVIFDLEGFTNFCKQIDPQLAVPEYLNEFLKWLFAEVKEVLIQKHYPEGYKTWADLPFLSKYLGDDVMFLWDTDKMTGDSIRNVVISMFEICEHYRTRFLKKISKDIISPPSKLRCGIARGAIYSVGIGNDFVGPCINMSARLQKLNSLSFGFSRRGLDPNKFAENAKSILLPRKLTSEELEVKSWFVF
jgi:class 3 adenylate cyclase